MESKEGIGVIVIFKGERGRRGVKRVIGGGGGGGGGERERERERVKYLIS